MFHVISPDRFHACDLHSLDDDFLHLFDQIPEEEATDHGTQFGLFLSSNEGSQEKTLAALEKHPLSAKVMLATSGFFALNAASVRGRAHQQCIDYLVLFDCSERVASFWSRMQSLIASSSTPSKLLEDVKELLRKNASDFWPPVNSSKVYSVEEPSIQAEKAIAVLEMEVKEGASWLASEEQYRVIKNIFDKNHFVFKRVNFCNQKAMEFFAKHMAKHKLQLDTVYLSNIREYVEYAGTDQGLEPFHASLKELKLIATDQTFFIDTRPRIFGLAVPSNITEGPLEQRVLKTFVSSSIEHSFPYSPFDEHIPSSVAPKLYFKAYQMKLKPTNRQ